MLETVGASPLKLHGLDERKKVKVCQRKLERVKRELVSDIAMAARLNESVLDEEDDVIQDVKPMKKHSNDVNSIFGKFYIKAEVLTQVRSSLQKSEVILRLVPEAIIYFPLIPLVLYPLNEFLTMTMFCCYLFFFSCCSNHQYM